MADNNDIEQKIKLTYETNANEAAAETNKLLKAEIALEEAALKLKKANEALSKSNGKSADEIKRLEINQKKAEIAFKDSEKALGDLSKSTKKSKGSLEDLGGGIGSTIKGFKGLIKQMWLLVANPAGLIIAAIALALTGLFKAFTSTKAGGEKFDQVLSGISATIDVLRDRVLKVGSAISKFFSGDFAGAIAEGKAAVSGFGDEVAAEFQKAANATKSLQEVADTMRELGVSRAELDRDLAESERILTDINATYAEKKKALEAVEVAERKQTDAELENARKKLKAIQAQNALSDSSSEALQAEADARISVIELEKKSSEDRRKVAEFNVKLNNEEQARIKELTTARKTAAKEREKIAADEAKAIADIAKKQQETEAAIQKAIEDQQDATEEERLQRRKEREEARLEALAVEGVDTREALRLNTELFNELEDELREKRTEEKAAKDEKEKADQLARDQKAADEQIRIEKNALDQKRAIEDAKFGLLAKGVQLFNNIIGKSKKAQKASLIASNALGLAEVAINTQRAVMADIAVPLGAGLPKVPIDIAAGALGAANIIASTAKGLKELGGGSGGSASGGSAPNVGSSSAPRVDFQASSENQIATTINQSSAQQAPIKAYVVTSDVSTGQALDRKKIENNSF